MKLRVAFLASSFFVGAEGFPFLGRHGARVGQRGNNDCALVQPGNACKQRRDGGRGRGHACGQGEAFGRALCPAIGHRVKQPPAPLSEIDYASLGEHCRPFDQYGPETFDRLEPMGGELGRFHDRPGQAR